MEIIQSFYYSSNLQRQQEIEHTLRENLLKTFINKIHLFIEDKDYNMFAHSEFMVSSKICIARLNEQPTYPQLFKYACTLNDTICCICNSDIEFKINDIDLFLIDKLKNEKTIYILSRHEHDMSKPQINRYHGSHDAVMFHSTLFNIGF